jgi:Family of unknown function (DUF6165)
MSVSVEVSYGELIDKITILEIKARHLVDPARQRNVETELAQLRKRCREALPASARLTALTHELKAINERLWEIENRIRIKERSRTFDQEFIELARSVYLQNDLRSGVKQRINEEFGSGIVEQKEYQEYGDPDA